MRRFWMALLAGSAGLVLASAASAYAAEEDLATDITKEKIVGPGSVEVRTGKDLLMSFGAMVRIIPTSETDYDFGMRDNAPNGFFGGALGSNFFRDHAIESGWVNNSYIRSEDRLYFNAMPKDRKWTFYAALEYDRALEQSSVDSRGGKSNDNSNFGLERLQGTMALPYGMRLHAGWDVWHIDAFDGGGLVYGDDNPGLWLTGGDKGLQFDVGYFKLQENDFQAGKTLNDDTDDDRTLYAGTLTWTPDPANKVRFFGAYDRIRSIPVQDLAAVFSAGGFGTSTGQVPETDSYFAGLYYVGTFGGLELFAEGVHQFGSADNTGLAQGDFDISAFAFAGDIAYDFKSRLGFSLKPHVGFMYTSGDDDPSDDELSGFTGATSAQRFSRYWGGENTIIGDTNLVFGSMLYGYIPELYGNGTPVFTGGVQGVSTGLGGGRGDNPGLSMLSVGLTVAPKPYLSYRTNVNMLSFNEDFQVLNWVTPAAGYTTVESGYAGTEWDNELIFALTKHTFIKGQAALLFPGDAIKDITKALGAESDDTAMRFAAELVWNF